MRKDLLSKTLVLGVVVLFVGVGVAPSITAELSIQTELINNKFQNNNNELVETIVEIHEIDGIKEYIVMLTKQQVNEFDSLIDDFKRGLEDSESTEETVELYCDMVESLDEFGLFPEDMTIDEAQQLVTDSDEQLKQFAIDKYHTSPGIIENYDCLITGKGTVIRSVGRTNDCILEVSPTFGKLLLEMLSPYLKILSMNLLPISPMEPNRWYPYPVDLGFGYSSLDQIPGEYYYYPCQGWIKTSNGTMGNNRIEGSFWGKLDSVWIPIYTYWKVGAIGFKGIKIKWSGERFLEGSAMHVKLGHNL